MLSGRADPKLHSNAKIANPNVTVLEWLHNNRPCAIKWPLLVPGRCCRSILNVARSGLPVNAGFAEATGQLSPKLQLLNQLQRQTPVPGQRSGTMCLLSSLRWIIWRRKNLSCCISLLVKPTILPMISVMISIWRPLSAATVLLPKLWQQLQADPFYRDQTTLLITTDHGRGDSASNWAFHAGARSLQQQLTGYLKPLAKLRQGIPGF